MSREALPTCRKRKQSCSSLGFAGRSVNKIDRRLCNSNEYCVNSSLSHLPFPGYINGVTADRFSELSAMIQNCTHMELVLLTKIIQPLLKRDFLSDLPYEVGQRILAYLEPQDLFTCARVSHSWLHASEDPLLWQMVCHRHKISAIPCPTVLSTLLSSSQSLNGPSSPLPTKCVSEITNNQESISLITPRTIWKESFIREHHIECNWRHGTFYPPKILTGHHNHVITCLEVYKNWAISGSDDSKICIWDVETGDCLTSLYGHMGGVWSMTVLPSLAQDTTRVSSHPLDDIPLLVSGSTDRTVRIWRLDGFSWAPVVTLFGHLSTVRCLAGWVVSVDEEACRYLHRHENSADICQNTDDDEFQDPDDRLFVSGSRDSTLRLWSTRRQECILVLQGHWGAVRCVQYCGSLIVSGSYDCTVRVWCALSGFCLRMLRHHTDRVYALLFDGVRVISACLDTKIRVWNLRHEEKNGGVPEQTFCGHKSLTSEMVLDSQRGRLVSSNADETIRVWDTKTGLCVNILAGPDKHTSAVTCVQLTEKFIISSSDDGTVKLWDAVNCSFLRDLVQLESAGRGGVVWRLNVSPTRLIAAAGSRCGTEATQLIVMPFDDIDNTQHVCQREHLAPLNRLSSPVIQDLSLSINSAMSPSP